MKKYSPMILLILIPLLLSESQAQYDYDNRLHLEITPYVWMTTLNGDLTINGEARKVNFTFEDFFRYSNLGLSGHIELYKGNWGLMFDYIYVDLLKDQTYSELTLVEVSMTRQISKLAEIIIGGRYFKAESEFRDNPESTKYGEQKWLDPIIGGRLGWDLTKHLVFKFRADVGGFGIGSKFAWNVEAGVGYNLSNITFVASYRIWYANYETGSGDNLFAYDMTLSGPGLAMVLHF